MPRRCVARFASPCVVLALMALAACAPAMVPAPLAARQPPYGRAPPPVPPGAPVLAAPVAEAGPAKVALLVPLSGANAELGQAMLDAAQLALFEAPDDRLTLVPRDTGGSAEGAARAARAVIADGARLILGPLLAAEVEAVKPLARDAHLNVIAFSTVTELAGGNTFLMGFLPRQEVVREVGQARERGLARFAVLAPNSSYGHLMADALRDVASASGAATTRVEFYDPRADDTAPAVRRLMPGGGAPAGVPDAAATGAPSFDALLLPEGGARLKQIARQVKEAEINAKPVQLLGSGLWDVPDIGNEPALVGGWFAAAPPERRQVFEQHFREVYGRNPPRLASLGYDAAALAAALSRGTGGESFSQQAILNPSGFSGVDGLFRFAPSGLVQRGLAVLEVEPQGDVVISPAPHTFQDLGY
ncbi:MAG TPA: penicillin-binding protein activator [Stellaceae bacterium]|nr:penicillin-binding protein activator [Stellaceae bacterium]